MHEKITAQEAEIQRSEAQLLESQVRQNFAQTQVQRYEKLLTVRSTSEEIVAVKKQEHRIAAANLAAAPKELIRVQAERKVLQAQLANLQLYDVSQLPGAKYCFNSVRDTISTHKREKG